LFPKARTLRLAPAVSAALAALLLAACSRDTTIVKRSLCPAVSVAQYAGDVTRFDPPAQRDSGAIALTATVTDLRGACVEGSPEIATRITFDVVAQRRDRAAAQTVTLPVFVAVTRGGDIVVTKQVVNVALAFPAGQTRAIGRGSAATAIARQSVALPTNINRLITRVRKPGETDAATDPLAEPKVKDAVRQASFEVLVGFELTPEELAYNATK
jgi:hypothetical protein